MMPFLKLHELHEQKFLAQRERFVRRHHHKPSVPWLMFCVGFAAGVGLMLLNF